MKILADSNIWIEFFNRPDSDIGNKFEYLLRNEEICIAGIILAELLQGAVSQKEVDSILTLREQFHLLETNEGIWIKSGVLSQQLRKKGIVLPLSDIIVGILSQENDCYMFTLDNHFKQIPNLKLL